MTYENAHPTLGPARGYKTFFMFNSDEHEIYPSHKFSNANETFIGRINGFNKRFIYFWKIPLILTILYS